MHDSSSATGMVRAINPEWGNIDTTFMHPDLEKLGISKGQPSRCSSRIKVTG
jgi:hypothetical protein